MFSTFRHDSPTSARAHLHHGVKASREELHNTLSSLLRNAPAALTAVGALLRSKQASSLLKGAARFATRHPIVCAAAGAALIYAITARGRGSRGYH
jgi:hypothetical protein